jgi:hypothetical protein
LEHLSLRRGWPAALGTARRIRNLLAHLIELVVSYS